MSRWIDHTIWWHVYPLGFAGAPIRPSPEERALSPGWTACCRGSTT